MTGVLGSLQGKTAVITGGASGIGLAMAQQFGCQGMNLVIADVEQAAIMRDKGMSSDNIVDTLKQGAKTRKDNASGGLNYLMGL